MIESHPTRRLAEFLAGLAYSDVPPAVVEATKDLFLDWVGSALAGKDARPVRALEAFAARMGPAAGPCELLTRRGATTSPSFAALVNGAASHVVEQDDVHNGSVFHPATVVFPAVVAVAQAEGSSARVDVPKGDPGNSLTRAEIEEKAVRLAGFRDAATEDELRAIAARVWRLDEEPALDALLPR